MEVVEALGKTLKVLWIQLWRRCGRSSCDDEHPNRDGFGGGGRLPGCGGMRGTC
jgi:hypothetical protein